MNGIGITTKFNYREMRTDDKVYQSLPDNRRDIVIT